MWKRSTEFLFIHSLNRHKMSFDVNESDSFPWRRLSQLKLFSSTVFIQMHHGDFLEKLQLTLLTFNTSANCCAPWSVIWLPTANTWRACWKDEGDNQNCDRNTFDIYFHYGSLNIDGQFSNQLKKITTHILRQ